MTAAINRLLIANRGEIAIRIMRAAAEMGISTVAIYSADDANALHVKKSRSSGAAGRQGRRRLFGWRGNSRHRQRA